MDFKDDEPALALYIHHDMVPLKFQSPDDDLSYKNLLEVINVSIVQIQCFGASVQLSSSSN